MTTEITAQLSNYRQSPRKVRLVADAIRGKSAEAALAELNFTVKRVSAPLKKLLESALANALHNNKLGPETLFIKRITVDGGVVLKRGMPRARGMMEPIKKRTSHISLVLGDREPVEEKGKTKKVKAVKEPKKSKLEASEAKS